MAVLSYCRDLHFNVGSVDFELKEQAKVAASRLQGQTCSRQYAATVAASCGIALGAVLLIFLFCNNVASDLNYLSGGHVWIDCLESAEC